MSEKSKINLNLTLGRIGNGRFAPAFAKLCGLTLHSGRDAYALLKTLDQLNGELATLRRTRENLLIKHGAKSNLEPLRGRLKHLTPALSPSASHSPEADAEREKIERQLAQLAPLEQLQLPETAPGYAPYQAELQAVEEQTVELFLDRKIPLPLERLDGVFTVFELKELLETICEPAGCGRDAPSPTRCGGAPQPP